MQKLKNPKVCWVRLFVFVLLQVSVAAQTAISGGWNVSGYAWIGSTTSESLCGPPDYLCSRQDLALAPPSGTISVPPQFGPNTCTPGNLPNCGNYTGANIILNDPDFSNPIVRTTDANTTTAETAACMQTDDSGNERLWNCAGTSTCGGAGPTAFAVKACGGNRYVMGFNPATMQVNQTTYEPDTLTTKPAWAMTNPNVLYATDSTTTTITEYVFASFQPPTLGSKSTLYDFGSTSCLGNPINGSGGTYTVKWNGQFRQSIDDNVFAQAFSNVGAQETGFHVAAYNVSSGTCYIYNTKTGVITANGVIMATIPTPLYTVHDAGMTDNPNYVLITPSATAVNCISGPCGDLVLWNISSGTIQNCTIGQCDGEAALGYSQTENGTGTGNWNIHPFANFNTYSQLITNSALIPTGLSSNCTGFTYHSSWIDNGSGTLPLIASFMGQCGTPSVPLTTAFQKEIIAVQQLGTYISRIAHNFTQGTNALSFDAQDALAQVSPDHRFIMFTSDLLCTLGTCSVSGGKMTCTAATTCGTNQRSDVFIVKPQ